MLKKILLITFCFNLFFNSYAFSEEQESTISEENIKEENSKSIDIKIKKKKEVKKEVSSSENETIKLPPIKKKALKTENKNNNQNKEDYTKYNSTIKHANELIKKSEFEKVIKMLEPLENKIAFNDELNGLMALSYLGLAGKLAQAYQILGEDNIDKNEAYNNIKNLLEVSNEYTNRINNKQIKDTFGKIINSVIITLEFTKAKVKINNKDYSSADYDLNNLLKKYPNQSEIYSWSGITKYYLGNKKLAFELINKSIKMDKNNHINYYNSACIYAVDGQKDTAMDMLEKSVALEKKLSPELRSIYPPIKSFAINDPELKSLRNIYEFKKLFNL
ncbi:MAG: hypothetical protein U0457_18505 [Candidatus Sericytochromatia bacterium]